MSAAKAEWSIGTPPSEPGSSCRLQVSFRACGSAAHRRVTCPSPIRPAVIPTGVRNSGQPQVVGRIYQHLPPAATAAAICTDTRPSSRIVLALQNSIECRCRVSSRRNVSLRQSLVFCGVDLSMRHISEVWCVSSVASVLLHRFPDYDAHRGCTLCSVDGARPSLSFD